jgi:hypothetical protein
MLLKYYIPLIKICFNQQLYEARRQTGRDTDQW